MGGHPLFTAGRFADARWASGRLRRFFIIAAQDRRMARGVPHPDDTRAAVLAALLAGQSIHEIATAYHLDRKTIREWWEASKREPVPLQKRPDVGGLVAAYLSTALESLRAQAAFSADTSWLREQSAADLAVLHGVLCDKAFRIIEALEDDSEPDSPADEVASSDE